MTGLSAPIIAVYLVAVLLIQSGIDLYFSRLVLPGAPKKRFLVLLAANGAALLFTGLIYRLTLPLSDAWLIASREQGSMAVAVLVMVVAYFFWMVPLVGIRGWIVQEWLLADAIREKRQAWWGYVWVGQVASLLLLGALYVALTIVPPLMLGIEDRFAG